MKTVKLLPALVLALFLSHTTSRAVPSFTLTSFCTGFTLPVDIAHCGDSRLFVVQQRGKIFIVDSTGVKRTTPFLDITSLVSSSGNERGLLGLAFHPNYKQNGYFYLNYTRLSDGATRVSRFSVNPNDSNLALSASELNLLTIAQPFSNHNGGNLEFGPDGYLYIGMGDGGSAGDPNNNAQNTTSRLGKMLRIDVNSGSPYGIPSDNPFATSSTAAKEIWTVGMRNPWRWSFDRLTGDLWIGDVGQDLYEEVDFQPAGSPGGLNYGWRCYEANGHPYNTTGCQGASNYVLPVFEYPHTVSTGTGNCSVTGGYVYRGAQMNNTFGYYLCTDYCSGRFWWIQKNGNTFSNGLVNTFLANQYVTMGEDKYGEMYVAGISNGIIYRITTANPCPVALILAPDTVAICQGTSTTLNALRGRGLTYTWTMNGVPANTNIYSLPGVNQAGEYQVTVSNTAGCSTQSQVVHVVVQPKPNFNFALSNTAPLCEGDSTVLTLSGGDTYVTSNLSVLTSPVTITDSLHTYVTAINSFGCRDSALVHVTKYSRPNYAISSNLTNNVLCNDGDIFTVSGSGGDGTYQWPTGAGTVYATSQDFSFAGTFQYYDSVGTCFYSSPLLTVTGASNPGLTAFGYAPTYTAGAASDTILTNVSGAVVSINGVAGAVIVPSSLQEGYNQVLVSYTDANNCLWTFADSVFMDFNSGLGQASSPSGRLFPNPVNRGNSLQVLRNSASGSVTVSDLTGKILLRTEAPGRLLRIDTTPLAPGIYSLHLFEEGKPVVYRFVVQ
jgi:glucose/arabinose dehydrogenase